MGSLLLDLTTFRFSYRVDFADREKAGGLPKTVLWGKRGALIVL
jgi:hypothetical protein